MEQKYKLLLPVAYEIVTGVSPRKITTTDKRKAIAAFVAWIILILTLFLKFNLLEFGVGVFLAASTMIPFVLYINKKMSDLPLFYRYREEIVSKHSELIEELRQVEDVISIEDFASKALMHERQKRKLEADAERTEILKKYEIDKDT